MPTQPAQMAIECRAGANSRDQTEVRGVKGGQPSGPLSATTDQRALTASGERRDVEQINVTDSVGRSYASGISAMDGAYRSHRRRAEYASLLQSREDF
jgi:hypothetical protein